MVISPFTGAVRSRRAFSAVGIRLTDALRGRRNKRGARRVKPARRPGARASTRAPPSGRLPASARPPCASGDAPDQRQAEPERAVVSGVAVAPRRSDRRRASRRRARSPGPRSLTSNTTVPSPRAHRDAVEAAAVLARVVDQVGQRARDQRRVGDERQRRRPAAPACPASSPGPLERAARDLARLERLARHGLELEPRARQQLAHQRVDLDRLAFDVVERRADVGDAPLAACRSPGARSRPAAGCAPAACAARATPPPAARAARSAGVPAAPPCR